MSRNLLTRFFEQRDTVNLMSPRDPALAELFGFRPASAGVDVSERTMLSWTALSAGIRLLSETMASLPIDVCRRMEPRGRKEMPGHPTAALLNYPNSEITRFELIDLMQGHAVWWGNAYAQIIFNSRGYPAELWPLSPDRVSVFRDSNRNLWYRVGVPQALFGPADESVILPADEVLHIRGFSRFGILGDRMSYTFREAIGLGLATELFGSLFFGQGANAGGFLEHPGVLTEDAQKRLLKQKENQASGLSRAHRLMILEEGMKWHQTTIEPNKAQFIDTRQFQVLEAARMLRVPPHLLYYLERATFSNIEQQFMEFVVLSLTPWAVRWEQRLAKTLLGFKDFASIYFKFRMQGLARGDMATRMGYYQSALQNGWLNPNEVRELEDINPYEGGDTYRVPVNTAPATTTPGDPNLDPDPEL